MVTVTLYGKSRVSILMNINESRIALSNDQYLKMKKGSKKNTETENYKFSINLPSGLTVATFFVRNFNSGIVMSCTGWAFRPSYWLVSFLFLFPGRSFPISNRGTNAGRRAKQTKTEGNKYVNYHYINKTSAISNLSNQCNHHFSM